MKLKHYDKLGTYPQEWRIVTKFAWLPVKAGHTLVWLEKYSEYQNFNVETKKWEKTSTKEIESNVHY